MVDTQVDGERCVALLAGTVSIQAMGMGDRNCAAIVMRVAGARSGLYQPLDRAECEETIAALRRALGEAGL
jgi:hypothetical protein